MINLTLPWPPSVNSYWRHCTLKRATRVLISAEGREYRRNVAKLVGLEAGRSALAGRLEVSIVACPPDNRKRDLDNLLKSLLDALAHAGVYADDGQIDRLSISRGPVMRSGGRVCVGVQEMQRPVHWREALGDTVAAAA